MYYFFVFVFEFGRDGSWGEWKRPDDVRTSDEFFRGRGSFIDPPKSHCFFHGRDATRRHHRVFDPTCFVSNVTPSFAKHHTYLFPNANSNADPDGH